jgi:hypothetical protein
LKPGFKGFETRRPFSCGSGGGNGHRGPHRFPRRVRFVLHEDVLVREPRAVAAHALPHLKLQTLKPISHISGSRVETRRLSKARRVSWFNFETRASLYTLQGLRPGAFQALWVTPGFDPYSPHRALAQVARLGDGGGHLRGRGGGGLRLGVAVHVAL